MDVERELLVSVAAEIKVVGTVEVEVENDVIVLFVVSFVLVCSCVERGVLVSLVDVEKVLLDSVSVSIALVGNVVVGKLVVLSLIVSGIIVCFRVDRGYLVSSFDVERKLLVSEAVENVVVGTVEVEKYVIVSFVGSWGLV